MSGSSLFSVMNRVLVLAVVWVAATEADPQAFGYGFVAVPATVAFTYVLTGAPRGGRIGGSRDLRRRFIAHGAAIGAIAALAGWVLWRSVLGAFDVARRALWLPRPDVEPYWCRHEVELNSRGACVAFALIMNLMPGTLTARLDGRTLDIHVVSTDLDLGESINSLTWRIRRVEHAFQQRHRAAEQR